MKCTELIYDGRTKKTRVCDKEIYGMTGLQELLAYKKHLSQRHKRPVDTLKALELRAETGQ